MSEPDPADFYFAHPSDLIEPWGQLFEDQRRKIGASYGLGNEIRTLVKQGIFALKKNDTDMAGRIGAELLEKWTSLTECNVPRDLGWAFDSENGQEVVEFILLGVFLPFLDEPLTSEEKKILQVPLFDRAPYGMEPQTWLSGLMDVPGELSKIKMERLCDESLSTRDRIELRKRWLIVAEYIYEFLDTFETAYPLVINASRRKGFMNTYRGKLARMSHLIEMNRRDLVMEIGNARLLAALEARAK